MNLTNNPDISLVKLPEKNQTYNFDKNENGTMFAKIAGWGKTENDTVTNQLLEAEMVVFDWEKCKEMNDKVADLISSQHICAIQTDNATRPTDTCQGDSGGPLIQYFDYLDFIQTEITSFGDGCATPGIPGAYTRVDQFIDWIDEVINKDYKQDKIEKLIYETTSEVFFNVTETTSEIDIKPAVLGGFVQEQNTCKLLEYIFSLKIFKPIRVSPLIILSQ